MYAERKRINQYYVKYQILVITAAIVSLVDHNYIVLGGEVVGYISSLYSLELPHRARAVYMYLHDRADKDGKCYPAIVTIARELKLSRSTVKEL